MEGATNISDSKEGFFQVHCDITTPTAAAKQTTPKTNEIADIPVGIRKLRLFKRNMAERLL